MPQHTACDWESQKAMVMEKLETLQKAIVVNSDNIKCVQKKVYDLGLAVAILPEMKKDLAEIKKELREQSNKNQSKLSNINIDLGKMQTRFYMGASIASFIIATGVSILLKFVL